MKSEILRLDWISKSFDHTPLLNYVNLTVYDPWANPDIVRHEYGIEVVNELPEEKADAVILAVAHEKFKGLDVESLAKEKHVIFDVKGSLRKECIDGRL